MNGVAKDSSAAPPPVSFGVTPTSSSASLPLPTVSQLGSVSNSARGSASDLDLQQLGTDDPTVPLTLRADQLTAAEAKTYLRWYNDIVVRRGTNIIRMEDVFNFLRNFEITAQTKHLLARIFKEVTSLNVGTFFALLRVISHTLLGQQPMRKFILSPAPIPKPKSILSAKRVQDVEEEEEEDEPRPKDKFDLDSFTQMLMTGETPKKKKKVGRRRIKFSDQVSVEPAMPKPVEPVKIDLSLPMDQLLKTMPHHAHNETPTIVVNEEEELKDMHMDRFQNIKNVDSALIHGTPSNIPSIFFDEMNNSPGMVSPQMEYPEPLAPSHTGPVRLMSPSHTGPVAFPSMMNGYISPNYEVNPSQALAPTMTGSLSSSMRNTQATSSPQNGATLAPPAPPQRRLRSSSSPNPVEHATVTLEQFANATMPSQAPQQQYQPHNTLPPPPPPPPQRIASPNRIASPSAPAPPPSRRRGVSHPPPVPPGRSTPSPSFQQQQQYPQQHQYEQPPALPPKTPLNGYSPYGQNNANGSGSAVDILDNLKALQNEVDRMNIYQQR